MDKSAVAASDPVQPTNIQYMHTHRKNLHTNTYNDKLKTIIKITILNKNYIHASVQIARSVENIYNCYPNSIEDLENNV